MILLPFQNHYCLRPDRVRMYVLFDCELMSKQHTSNTCYGWFLWFLAALFYAYEFVHRIIPSILTVQLREAFNINEEQLALIGACYFYAYAPFQLLSGVLIDRFGTRYVLIAAAGLLTAASFVFDFTTHLYLAYFSRFLIGVGSAFAFVGCLKIGAQWLGTKTFPFVIGLTNLFGTLGALLAGAPLSLLVTTHGWRNTFFGLSMLGLLITMMLIIFLKNAPSTQESAVSSKNTTLFAGLLFVMRNPQSWLIALYGALLVIPITALPEMWGVEYLRVAYDYSAQKAASITHIIFLGTALGGPLIGWLVRNSKEEIDLMMLATLGALTLLSLFLYWVRLPEPQLYLILFFYGILTANMLLCFDLICRVTPTWAQGAAIGFVNMIVMALGGLGQHGVGWILNQLRMKHDGIYLVEDYHIALSVLPFCLLAAIFLTLFIRHHQHDAT